MEWKDKRGALAGIWKRYKGMILILVAGIAFLSWPAQEKAENIAAAVQAEMESAEETEARMERILARIEGVGELKLMLTVENSVRQEMAVNTELSYRGDIAAPGEYSRQSEMVIVSDDQGEGPVVVYSRSPVYRGAVVVCQGAGNPGVRLAVTQAVAALTGLGSDRIMVIKCQS